VTWKSRAAAAAQLHKTTKASATLQRHMLRAAPLLALLPLASAVVYELSEDNFDRLVFGPKKTPTPAFIKFYAPWCGHCQKLAPDWKKLEKAYSSSSSLPLLVGSVDCSDGPPQPGAPPGQGGRNPLCDKHKAMSLPTLLFFEPGSTKGFTYEGNKTADDLLAFGAELASTCSPSELDACSEEQKAWFAEYEALPAADLKSKASEIMMQGDMAKMRLMMAQMQMQEQYSQIQSLPKAQKDAKMKEFEGQMEEAGKESDTAWEKSGSLRAMRMVLKTKDPAALAEIDEFDMMQMMMGGGPGGPGGMGGGGGPGKKKKKKKAKKAKDEV